MRIETPVGTLSLVGGDAGLRGVLWEETRSEPHPVLDEAARQLAEYFAGERREFDLPLDLVGTAFQRRAWLALGGIPFGETRS